MCVSAVGPEIIIDWGVRLLYVSLFIAFTVVMGYWWYLPTYTFVGSIMCLVFPALLFFAEQEEEKETAPEGA